MLCGRPTLASNLSAKVIRNKALSETRPDVDLSQGSRPYCRCPYSLLTCQNIEKGLLGGGGLGSGAWVSGEEIEESERHSDMASDALVPSSVLAPSSKALVSTSFLLLLVRHLLLLVFDTFFFSLLVQRSPRFSGLDEDIDTSSYQRHAFL